MWSSEQRKAKQRCRITGSNDCITHHPLLTTEAGRDHDRHIVLRLAKRKNVKNFLSQTFIAVRTELRKLTSGLIIWTNLENPEEICSSGPF